VIEIDLIAKENHLHFAKVNYIIALSGRAIKLIKKIVIVQ